MKSRECKKNSSVFGILARNNNKEKVKRMKKRNTAVLLGLSFTLLFLFFASLFFGASGLTDDVDAAINCWLAPLNPDFLKYIDSDARKSTDPGRTGIKGGHLLGGVPSPVDLSHIRGTIDETVNDVVYPSYYDLRQLDRVTIVKNQRGYPTCWIFAAFCSLESCLLPEEVDFSEWHMAHSHGFDYVIDDAGNSYMTTAYFIRWSGPVSERDVPYESSTNMGRYYPLVKHVQQAVFLPEREGPLDNNTIKYFVTNYGPVDFAYFWVFEHFNDSTNAIYTRNNEGQNHRLTIVGWNDHYPASNFLQRPPGNGAFIARNSWGSNWAEGGYCYISYYDNSFQHFVCFNNAESPTNYGTIYQYDPLGQTRTWGQIESWGANVFSAQNRAPLLAVGFYATDANMNYEVTVYKNVDTAAQNPTSGEPAAFKAGASTYAGYYTVRLDTPVPLERGETFSVVVKFINSKYRFSVPIEAPIVNHSSAAAANRGESYVSLDGSQWEDLIDEVPASNVCIKAYSEYRDPSVSVQAERKSISGWIINREYANITIQVDNLQEEPVSRLILYRSTGTSEYEELCVVAGSALETMNGIFKYKDKYLERIYNYTYMAVTLDEDGSVIEGSVPVTI
jgi:C1A family cysteine protease